MDLLPFAVRQVLFPRMAEQYGRTGKLQDLVAIVWRPTMLTMAVMAPMAMVGPLVGSAVLRIVMPNYTAPPPPCSGAYGFPW